MVITASAPFEELARVAPAIDFGETADDPIVLRAPTQCQLWAKPHLVATQQDVWSSIEKLTRQQKLPYGQVQRLLLTCGECGQRFLFENFVNNAGTFRTFIPIDVEAVDILGQLPVWDLMRLSPRLQWDQLSFISHLPHWAHPDLTVSGHLSRPKYRDRPTGVTEAEIQRLPAKQQIEARLKIAQLVRNGRERRHLSVEPNGRVFYDYHKVEEDQTLSG